MSDSINREDAIKEIEDLFFLDAYDKDIIIDRLLCLPSADAEWIPVSERLPNEYGEYLATVDGETIEVSYVPETKGLVRGWSTCNAYGYKWLSDDDVIAWRPKPKPYKESEVEE